MSRALPSFPGTRIAHPQRNLAHAQACIGSDFITAALKASTLALAPVIAGAAFATEPTAYSPETKRRNELITLVRQDCGSCHGLKLTGGLGPALLPETLKDKDPEGLKATILHGRPGTAMPPWGHFLSEAEAEWIVTNLQRGFPDDR